MRCSVEIELRVKVDVVLDVAPTEQLRHVMATAADKATQKLAHLINNEGGLSSDMSIVKGQSVKLVMVAE